MKPSTPYRMVPVLGLALLLSAGTAGAQVFVQCPGDTDGNAVPDHNICAGGANKFQLCTLPAHCPSSTCVVPSATKATCTHLTAGDGFIMMADGKHQYMFGFKDVTGVPANQVMNTGQLGASFSAPTIALDEGQEFYLNLTNVGMLIRPDLFDPHSVHFHGFPQAAPIFDGMPEGSLAIDQTHTLTYYYKIVDPGTYMYHCHVEATEHMQMGMLGNLYVRPAQDGQSKTYNGKTYTKFAYNDGNGSSGYDVDFPIQLGSFDPDFHDASEGVQPLPFALMRDRYPMINGRGYPDTVNPDPLDPPQDPPLTYLNANDPERSYCAGGTNADDPCTLPADCPLGTCSPGKVSQAVSSLIKVVAGKTILLRISNLNVTRFHTLASSLPMRVVGQDARLLRGPTGRDTSWTTNSVTLGGGESYDALIDTRGVPNGTYFLYTTNLNLLSNDAEDYGGMMTEIVIGAPS